MKRNNNPERHIVQIHDMSLQMSDDFAAVQSRIPKDATELRIRFILTESDLNQTAGKRICDLLANLRIRCTSIKVIRPLPRCVLGLRWQEISKAYSIPEGCAECEDLFTLDDGNLMSCSPIGAQGPNKRYMKTHEEIAEFFNTVRLEKKPLATCDRCLHFLRNTCDGLCFRQ
jgi:hypothetical protein